MRKFGVLIKAFNEFLWYGSYDTREVAEDVRHTLEKRMYGVKVEVCPWEDTEDEPLRLHNGKEDFGERPTFCCLGDGSYEKGRRLEPQETNGLLARNLGRIKSKIPCSWWIFGRGTQRGRSLRNVNY